MRTSSKTLPKLLLSGAACVLSLLASGNAAAGVTDTWRFDSGHTSTQGDWYIGADNGLRVKVSGWYEDSGDQTIYDASNYVEHYSGGMGLDRPGDSHTLDNGGDSEFFAFEFEHAVSLTSFEVGYVSSGYDSDVSVLHQNGTNGSLGDLSGERLQDPNSIINASAGGYSVLGHYANVGVNTKDVTAESGDNPDTPEAGDPIFSKVWVVGAFLGNVPHAPHWTVGNDRIKFRSLVAMKQPGGGGDVPAPATLLLLAAGMVPVLRRRKGARA